MRERDSVTRGGRGRLAARPALFGALTVAVVCTGSGACASSPDTGSEAAGENDSKRAQAESGTLEDRGGGPCVRNATVTVRVYNESSAAVRLSFGPYAPARIAEAFERTTYNVPRPHLRHPVMIQVARGGLQVGPAPRIVTEPVVCNVATLVIGARPRYSVFYGDVIYETSDLLEAIERREAEEAAADSAAAADSTLVEDPAADSAAVEPTGGPWAPEDSSSTWAG